MCLFSQLYLAIPFTNTEHSIGLLLDAPTPGGPTIFHIRNRKQINSKIDQSSSMSPTCCLFFSALRFQLGQQHHLSFQGKTHLQINKWHGWWLITVGSREHPSLLGHCMGALTSPGLLPLPYSFLCFLLFTPSTVLQWLSFLEPLQVCSPVRAAICHSICDLKFATWATK